MDTSKDKFNLKIELLISNVKHELLKIKSSKNAAVIIFMIISYFKSKCARYIFSQWSNDAQVNLINVLHFITEIDRQAQLTTR